MGEASQSGTKPAATGRGAERGRGGAGRARGGRMAERSPAAKQIESPADRSPAAGPAGRGRGRGRGGAAAGT